MNSSSQNEIPSAGPEDPMPPRDPSASTRRIRILGFAGKFMGKLPQPALEAVLRRAQKPSVPSRKLVPSTRVLRERVGQVGDTVLGVRVTWIDKPRSRTGTIVHLHGGAYVMPELPGHWTWLEELSRRAGTSAAMVHYRMPPEAPFPAALDDAVRAIRAMVESSELMDGEWVLAGDSAGGGLAVAVLQRLRDEGGPLPAGVVLLSPWMDLTMDDPLVAVQAHTDLALEVNSLRRCAEQYIGAYSATDPRISPRFGTVEGLPPVLIFVGSDELVLSDSRHLRDDLEAAGVPVAYVEQPGGQHTYPLVSPGPAAQWAMRRSVAFVRRALGRDA